MWSNFPPEPVPIDAGAERRPAASPDPPRPSRMLPVVQCLAEGGLLAVVAAALQALFGEVPIIGPLEFAILAGAGMAWARRSPRRCSRTCSSRRCRCWRKRCVRSSCSRFSSSPGLGGKRERGQINGQDLAVLLLASNALRAR
jgi:hypothetical protein